jgi:hypothetical protein
VNKNKEQLLAIMADNSISYVIEGKEAYIKLANQQYNTIQTTVVEGVEELDIEGDKKRTLWWVDLNMWPHLNNGILQQLTAEPMAKPDVTMLWNPRSSVNHKQIDDGKQSAKLQSMTVMGGRVLSLETNMTVGGASGGIQKLATAIYAEFAGSYELTQADPRHIGTHRDQTLPPQHKHIVKRGGGEWSEDDVDTVYALAMSLGLTAWDPVFGAKNKKVRDLSKKA